MADEAAYGAVGGESNKRKYEDSPRRTTGFSSAPDSAGPPSSYNSVPPPPSEIELAKQKVQEIAARLLNNSDPLKRARVENGASVGGGFDSFDAGNGQRHPGLGLSDPPQGASYGYPGPSKKIDIPSRRVGVIIGKGGDTIKYLQVESGAKIQVTRDTDADPNSTTRAVELTGSPDQIARAEQLISDVLSEAETGGSGIVNRRMNGQATGAEQFSMKVPNNKVGLVIGKGGETIKSMQAQTGARIQVIPLHLPPGDMSKERTVQIDGTNEQIEAAKQLVEEVTSENRMRNQPMGGGYGYNQQQQGQAPPTNWGQPGYGYPGPPHYNMNQQQPNYPPASWDPSTAPPQNQQSGYDYYSQPPTQGAPPVDGSGYNYNQGYGYDQAYNNAAASYSNVTNPTPSPNPSYPNQGPTSTQPGYGYGSYAAPSQSSQPAAYGQPQQSPSAQYSQAQYVQMGYAQADAGAQRPPVPQPGYGAPPPYGGGYGQQAYASGYGGGYSTQQAPAAYPTDAAAAPHSTGVAKASPPP